MRKKGKIVVGVVVAIVIVLLLVGPLSIWRWVPMFREPPVTYKVGAIFAVTGPAAWLGTPERNTAKMIEEEVNKAGGINGHPLEIIIEDTVGDATKAVTATKKLITKDQVLAIVGPSRSGTTMALQGISKIALITGTTGFGDQGRKQLKKLAPELEIEIVADETYGPNDTDMTAQLTKIKASEAQAVVNWSIVPGQVIVAKNMRQLGMKIPLFQSHGFGNIKYAQTAGEAGEGIIFPCGRLLAVDTLASDHPQKEVLAKYKKEYETKYEEDVSTFGGHAWDGLQLIIAALREVGPDREKIRNYIENTKNFVGTGGIFNFSPEDHSGLTKDAFEMLIVKNEKFVVLE